MKTPRWLVTGGAGFIGSHLVEELVARGESVRVLDNFSTGKLDNLSNLAGKFELMHGDIREMFAVKAAMSGIEFVLHEAAIASVPQSLEDPVRNEQTNVQGTINVLLAARDAKVKRVVQACSCAVYGNSMALPLTEYLPSIPLSPYAASKVAGEAYGVAFFKSFGLEYVALRYFNVFGPRQDPASPYAAVIPKFVSAYVKNRRPVVFGTGEQTRDFVFVRDVVEANLAACTSALAPGRVFNVGSGKETSLLEVLDALNRKFGVQMTPEFEFAQKGDISRSCADVIRAREVLGFTAKTSFVEGLDRTAMWFTHSQPRWTG